MQITKGMPAGKAGMIMVLDGLLDKSVCDQLVTKVNSVWNHAHPGETLGGIQPESKITEDFHFAHDAYIRKSLTWDDQNAGIEADICLALTKSIAIYKQEYRQLDSWLNVGDTGFQVQRYPANYGYYRTHVDAFPQMNSKVGDRVLASVIYLTDVEYGGETHFPLHEVKVKPRAGRIVLFPAQFTHPHESCVPINEDKWIISSFITNVLNPFHHEEHHEHSHEDHDHHHEPELILGTAPWPA